MEKEDLKECLTMFYAAVRREDGTEFKVSSLKAIRAAIDRYLRHKYFFNLQLLFFIIAFFCQTSWVILKQLDPSPSRATGQ